MEEIKKLKRVDKVIKSLFSQQYETNKSFTSGFDLIDTYSAGLRKGQFVVLGARPGVGKTTFLTNIIRYLRKGMKEKEVVLVFSLEMTAEELASKLISIDTGISLKIFKAHQFDEKHKKIINQSMEMFQKYELYFFDDSHLTIKEIENIVVELMEKGITVKSIMVDHIQLVEDKTGNSKYEKVSNVSRGLKKIAKDYKTNVIGLSQISREVENDNPKARPKKLKLSDLKNSGSIEQDADVVFFLSTKELLPNGAITLKLEIAKNRNGALASGEIVFNPNNGRMIDSRFKKELKNE